jgi:hypothetical protein
LCSSLSLSCRLENTAIGGARVLSIGYPDRGLERFAGVVGQDWGDHVSCPPKPLTPPGACDGGSVDVPTGDTDRGTVEREILAGANLVGEVYLVKAAARARDRPQIALELVNLAGVESKHPARRALQDGLPYVFSGGVLTIVN